MNEMNGNATDEQLAKINLLTRREMNADELYVFPVILCDNQIDRDGERFSVKCLRELADLYVGVTGIFDHNTKGANQTARIFSTEIVENPSSKTNVDEQYTALKGYVYMVKSDATKDLILEIDAGIKKEVSVGCMVKNTLCSVCGESYGGKNCKHIKGRLYGENKIPCHAIHMGSVDAYEWSFVAVPAQPRAGVTKSCVMESGTNGELIREIVKNADNPQTGEALAELRELQKLAEIGEEYRDELCREYVKLCYLTMPTLSGTAALNMARNMPHEELVECAKALRKTTQAMPSRQISGRVREITAAMEKENEMFRL